MLFRVIKTTELEGTKLNFFLNLGTMTRMVTSRVPKLLLIAGGAAWILALVLMMIVLRSTDSPEPDAPTAIKQRPSLVAATATAADTPAPTPTGILIIVPTPAPRVQPTSPPTPGMTSSSIPANSPTGTTSSCAPPEGWEPYQVQTGDTLFAFSLGVDGTVTVEELLVANCLDNRMLQIGQMLYLPPGAAENAPSSDPVGSAGSDPSGPRTPNCPCTISVSEGWRREQIADAINQSETMFTGADFLTVTGPGASAPHDFVTSRPPGTSLEGFLFPGTYTVQNDTTAEGFRNMLLDAFGAAVSPQIRADAAAQGVSFYEALIIASIVQREVHGPETQKLVASVYYNRYRDGNRLASTVPIQYALGGPGNWWPRVNSSNSQVDSPYNTYTRAGLPPTPIDSPGLNAILAGVYPAQTDYYYHTASCEGGEAFAVTYEEHLANVNCE